MKHLVEQKDEFGQLLTLEVRLQNGEPLNLNKYLRDLVETQSLEAWNGNQDKLRDWLAERVSDLIRNADVKIYGWGKVSQ